MENHKTVSFRHAVKSDAAAIAVLVNSAYAAIRVALVEPLKPIY